jgi:hypothetical protein
MTHIKSIYFSVMLKSKEIPHSFTYQIHNGVQVTTSPIENDAQEINSSNFIVPWSGKLKNVLKSLQQKKEMLLKSSIDEQEGCEFQECMLELLRRIGTTHMNNHEAWAMGLDTTLHKQ